MTDDRTRRAELIALKAIGNDPAVGTGWQETKKVKAVMSKKKEPETFARHCEMFIGVKDGKATCPKCKAVFAGGKWSKAGKVGKKRDAGRGRNVNDMVFDLGMLLLIVPPALWFMGIWNNGLQSFKMDLFTLVIILALVGFAMVGGFGKGKKA